MIALVPILARHPCLGADCELLMDQGTGKVDPTIASAVISTVWVL